MGDYISKDLPRWLNCAIGCGRADVRAKEYIVVIATAEIKKSTKIREAVLCVCVCVYTSYIYETATQIKIKKCPTRG